MTENELIEEAKNRYPIGCKAKNHKCDKTFTITHSFEKAYSHNGIMCNCSNGSYTIYDSELNKWAEIVSYPEGYIPKSTNLLQNLEIW